MSRTVIRICCYLSAGVFLAVTGSGCNMARMQQQMSHFWRNGIVGEDMGSAEMSDPWATRASQEMSAHHPPGYTDPSDRFLSSERAQEINRGLDGAR